MSDLIILLHPYYGIFPKIKRNKLLIHAAARMTIKGIILSVKKPTSKGQIPFAKHYENNKIIEIENRLVMTRRWGGKGRGMV